MTGHAEYPTEPRNRDNISPWLHSSCRAPNHHAYQCEIYPTSIHCGWIFWRFGTIGPVALQKWHRMHRITRLPFLLITPAIRNHNWCQGISWTWEFFPRFHQFFPPSNHLSPSPHTHGYCWSSTEDGRGWNRRTGTRSANTREAIRPV